jgi:transcriptional regulator of arginine metabolism
MSDKAARQQAILDLVRAHEVGSQDELRRLLDARGWEVTQSTLSRDMKELGLARVQTPSGPRYTAPSDERGSRPVLLDALLPQLFRKLDGVGELLVLKTVPGSAQVAAAALDAEDSPDLVGTLAGDDTVLLICRSAAAKERLSRRILKQVQR